MMNTENESYIRRRNWLLERMKREKWDEEQPKTKRGRKPKPIPQPTLDKTKPRNKLK